MGVSRPGIPQQDLADGVMVPGDGPLGQNLLAIGVRESGPPLADVAGPHPQGVRRQHQVLRGHGAVLGGEEEALGGKASHHGGGAVEGVGEVGVIGNAGLLPGDVVAVFGHPRLGVGPFDLAQAGVHGPVLAHGEEDPLPPPGAGGIEAGLEDLRQGFLPDLFRGKPPDGPAVEDGFHHGLHLKEPPSSTGGLGHRGCRGNRRPPPGSPGRTAAAHTWRTFQTGRIGGRPRKPGR